MKTPAPTLLYLDVCALSRPFDDQHQLRIRLETDAVNLILSQVKRSRYGLLVSPVHRREIAAISDVYERSALQAMLDRYGACVVAEHSVARQRAEGLVAAGFGVADAAHVAFAEQASDAFVSTDDRLLKKCARHVVTIWTGNPVAYCEQEQLR
jgi:predicted nucleic acid-binding protein